MHYQVALERYGQVGDGDAWMRATENVIGTFSACKSVIQTASPEELEARLAARQGAATRHVAAPRSDVRLFVSHRSTDAPLAEAVVKLLQAALGLPPTAIRCSSVNGYRLPAGADTDDRIHVEVLAAEVVIGLISTASLESLYVAFELGARWGRDPDGIVPLMAPGVSGSELPGPLGGKNALSANDRGQVLQLVTDVARRMRIAPHDPATYQKELEAVLVCSASTDPRPLPASSPKVSPGLEGHRPRLIVEYRDNGESVEPKGQRFVVENRGGDDAIDLMFERFEFEQRAVVPQTIRLLKSMGESLEIVCDVRWKDRDSSEYGKPLAEHLSSALRRAGPQRDGNVTLDLVATYRGLATGSNYEQRFRLRYMWAIQKFEPVEIL
jgi:hypothetical protein